MKSKKQPSKPTKETERGRAIAVYNPLTIFDEVLLDAKSRVEQQSGFSRHVQLVYDAPDWSLAALLSWVIWQDQNRICDINHCSDWRNLWSRQVRYEADGMNAMTAWRTVLTALQNGKLVAIENGAARAAEHWYGVEATTKGASASFNRNPHFRREEVLHQWPAEANQVSRRPRKYSSPKNVQKIYEEYIQYTSHENKRPTQSGLTTYALDKGWSGNRNLLRDEFRQRNPDMKVGRPRKENSPK
jgi:hypothetical protein